MAWTPRTKQCECEADDRMDTVVPKNALRRMRFGFLPTTTPVRWDFRYILLVSRLATCVACQASPHAGAVHLARCWNIPPWTSERCESIRKQVERCLARTAILGPSGLGRMDTHTVFARAFICGEPSGGVSREVLRYD